MITAPKTRILRLARPLDLRLTLAPVRSGQGDPCILLRYDEAYRASRTPDGAVTIHVIVRDAEVSAEAWGDGADWALEQLPSLLGEDDVDDFRTDDALVADLHRRTPGLRIGRTERAFEALLPAMCSQKVSKFEGRRAYRQVVQAFGEPAPGPAQLELLLPPDPTRLASAGHQDLHTLGLDRTRADVVRRAAARAASIESVIDCVPDDAERRLRSVAGVTIWTAAAVRQTALGDPDAVPVGDLALAHLVAWVFRGERRGTDALMLELLEPFRGHRGRVLRLLKASGLGPPLP